MEGRHDRQETLMKNLGETQEQQQTQMQNHEVRIQNVGETLKTTANTDAEPGRSSQRTTRGDTGPAT